MERKKHGVMPKNKEKREFLEKSKDLSTKESSFRCVNKTYDTIAKNSKTLRAKSTAVKSNLGKVSAGETEVRDTRSQNSGTERR